MEDCSKCLKCEVARLKEQIARLEADLVFERNTPHSPAPFRIVEHDPYIHPQAPWPPTIWEGPSYPDTGHFVCSTNLVGDTQRGLTVTN